MLVILLMRCRSNARLDRILKPAVEKLLNGLSIDSNWKAAMRKLSTMALTTSPVGTYPISVGNLAAGENYNLSVGAANVVISPAPLTVRANDVTARLGAAIPGRGKHCTAASTPGCAPTWSAGPAAMSPTTWRVRP